MHHCLQVSELFSQILWDLIPTEDELIDNVTGDIVREEKEGLCTLAALARTCTALHEPTMNVLWYNLDDITPVFKCLPSQFWKESHSDDKLGVHGFGKLWRLVSLWFS